MRGRSNKSKQPSPTVYSVVKKSTSGWAAMLAVCALAVTPVQAREYAWDIDVASREDIQNLVEDGDLDEDSATQLITLFQQPLDLNLAGRDALYELPGITLAMAEAIVAERNARGPFHSLDDLGRVPGVTPEVVAAIGAFAHVPPRGMLTAALGGVVTDTKLTTLWRGSAAGAQSPQGFISVQSRRGADISIGADVTYRQRARVYYAASRGYLVSGGADDEADLERLYLIGRRGAWSAVLGDYIVGFGESLTFDNTNRRAPHGWLPSLPIGEDLRRGAIRPAASLFGAAVSHRGPASERGRWDTTVFVSYKRHDDYQYDLRYTPDTWLAPLLGPCSTPGSEQQGFTCGEDGRWYSSRVLDSADDDATYRYLTYADAVTEVLGGADMSWFSAARARLGITAYTARVAFDPALGAVYFAPSARYPDRARLAAFGLHARVGELAVEVARTQGGGNGAYGRIVGSPVRWLEVTLAARWYDPWYENPHGRGEAAPDEDLGLRQRNEQGMRVQAVVRPLRRLRWVTDVDVWQNPYRQVVTADGVQWRRDAGAPWDLRLGQRLAFNVTATERLVLSARFDNKDLERNGRGETYQDGDGYGAGERRKIQLAAATRRWWDLDLGADYAAAWEDVAASDHFHRQDQLHLRMRWQPRPVTVVNVAVGATIRPVGYDGSYYPDRERSSARIQCGVSQVITPQSRLDLRYANLQYHGGTLHHFAKLAFERRF